MVDTSLQILDAVADLSSVTSVVQFGGHAAALTSTAKRLGGWLQACSELSVEDGDYKIKNILTTK